MAQPFADAATFLAEVKDSFHTIGALAPSSRWVGRALSKQLAKYVQDPSAPPVRILEVGAGTGPVTAEIVKCMRPGDSLDAVELNARFAERLQGRFTKEPAFQRVASQSRVHAIDFQQLPVEEPYPFVICGLPFNNFSPELVRALFGKMHHSVAANGSLSFFEYWGIRRLKGLVSSPSERQRLSQVANILGQYLERFEYSRDLVWLNLVPTVVHHLRANPQASAQEVQTGEMAR